MSIDRVVIYEPNFSGHRFYYVALLLDGCREKKIPACLVTSAEATSTDEYAVHLARFEKADLQVVAAPGSSEYSLLAYLKNKPRNEQYLTVFPDSDRKMMLVTLAGLLTLRGNVAINALLMRTPWGEGAEGVRGGVRVLKKIFIFLLSHLPPVTFYSLVAMGSSEERHQRVPTIEDPPLIAVKTGPTADSLSTSVSGAPRVALVAGVLDDRKRIREIVSVWSASPPEGWVLVLLGKVSEELAIYLEKSDAVENLIQRDLLRLSLGYQTDGTLARAIDDADAVLVLQLNQSPSGIAILAVSAGTPLIVDVANNLLAAQARLLGKATGISDISELTDCLNLLPAHAKDFAEEPPSPLSEAARTQFMSRLLSLKSS